jgi:hypothetical protein
MGRARTQLPWGRITGIGVGLAIAIVVYLTFPDVDSPHAALRRVVAIVCAVSGIGLAAFETAMLIRERRA